MKNTLKFAIVALIFAIVSCSKPAENTQEAATATETPAAADTTANDTTVVAPADTTGVK